MRDIKRIERMLATIKEKWLLNPDLRLGQIIINAVRPEHPCPEVFYIEDTELEKSISTMK
ncbi:MAG TPA: hypothetical protein PLU72_19775 [Candidatus Ozemobacteraceae bacterium]|nr:hypothetical protein [Candidatus Ozemobacteraceae bacterium]